MVEEDMKAIDIKSKKYELPANSNTHMDVYKIECEIPLLLNFYYVDETASIPELNYGQVAITTLKSYKTVSFPFAEGVFAPLLTVEVFNPNLNMYVFSFPNNEKRLNYTYASLIASGTKQGDNIKYCYGTNIGSAILPSKENCYRVSLDNSYTLKFLNPFTKVSKTILFIFS